MKYALDKEFILDWDGQTLGSKGNKSIGDYLLSNQVYRRGNVTLWISGKPVWTIATQERRFGAGKIIQEIINVVRLNELLQVSRRKTAA